MAPEPEPAWTEPDGQLRYAIEAIDGLDESDLACPLCFHLPNRAKRLPCCNATICLTCAKTFLASRLAAEVSKTTSTPDSLESEPRCPFCAQSVVKCIANPTTTNLKFASRNSSSNLLPTLSIKPSVDASGSKKTVHISLTLSDDDVAQTILNDLECHCLYRKAGCQWIGKRSDIDSHLTKSCNLAARAKGLHAQTVFDVF
ncbi:hypothetical protein BJ742DRAFT_48554 [Cladochytrium replicatum]|nr:hypothetical protein BJ742DRAFT_48554 [Cladochytrium replicatum]